MGQEIINQHSEEGPVMNPSTKILGTRVRTFRKRSGLTQKDLASRMGFGSKETISQIERGDREVKAWELAQLAKLLSVELNDILSIEKPQLAPSVLWRAVPNNQKDEIEVKFLKKCRDYALLEELSGLKSSRSLPQKNLKFEDLSYEMINALANSIRDEFNLGRRPAVELEKTLQDGYGVKIWYFELKEGSAASTIGHFGPAILMNSQEAPWRRNYNFAHELFHLITWDNIPPNKIRNNAQKWEQLEKYANAFASSLLLPSEPVLEEFERKVKNNKITFGELIDIARNFDVSTEALLFRLLNLRRLQKGTVTSLLKNNLFRETDKATMSIYWRQPPDQPERFVRLGFVAYQKGALTKAKLAELFDTSLLNLPEKLNQYGLNLQEGYDTQVRAA
jgi:Zn-dependent peptidase ImmA (M78 family)/DNA-binding XRE family transcriptional regulator